MHDECLRHAMGAASSVAAFAREHGLKHQRLSGWRKRLGEWDGSALAAAGTPPVRFVPAIEQGSPVAHVLAQVWRRRMFPVDANIWL